MFKPINDRAKAALRPVLTLTPEGFLVNDGFSVYLRTMFSVKRLGPGRILAPIWNIRFIAVEGDIEPDSKLLISSFKNLKDASELPVYAIDGISEIDSSFWVLTEFFYKFKMAMLAAAMIVLSILWYGNFEVQGLMRDSKVTDSYDRLNKILLLLKTDEYEKGSVPSEDRTNKFKRIINGIEASE